MGDLIGYIVGIPLVLFALYLCLAIPYSTIIKPLYKGIKTSRKNSLFKEINDEFLNKWKDFPGPNYNKYFFVIIGLYGWIEMALYPKLAFLNITIEYLWNWNQYAGILGIIILVGQIACSIYWFPTYVWTVIKVSKKFL